MGISHTSLLCNFEAVLQKKNTLLEEQTLAIRIRESFTYVNIKERASFLVILPVDFDHCSKASVCQNHH